MPRRNPYSTRRARVARIFGHEPAVVAAAIQAVLAMAVSFGWLAWAQIDTQAELGLTMGLVIAVLDVYVAAVTRRTLLALVVGLFKALIAFGSIYGFSLTLEQTGTVIAVLTALAGLWHQGQTEPLEFAEFDFAA